MSLRQNLRRKALQPIAIFVFLSILVHIAFWLGIYIYPDHPRSPNNEPVEVSYIEKKEETPDTQIPRQLKQIVEQKNQINDEVDKKAKYLSAFNQKIQEETRVEKSGKFNNKIAGGASPQGRKASQETKREKKVAAKGELPNLRDLVPKFAPTRGQAQQPNAVPGEEAQTDDYLKDVKKGIQTMLTTREFVYYSYYSRIKEQISQYWEPNVREKVKIVYRQGRTIASGHDRVTQLMIILDGSGQLIKIEVLGASGVNDLDDAAIEAFRSAAPFPNPPKGMVESDGTIKIRWDFILEA